MNYILHFCRNKKCNNGWIDKDLTHSQAPPKWKYCIDCCNKLGIDFDSQTPTSNLTEKELKLKKKKAEQIKKSILRGKKGGVKAS